MADPINIAELPFQQLQAVRQQMEEEIQHLTSSYAQLKQAQVKFNDCVDSLDSISGNSSGELGDIEKVIVDVGTGYMVEKTIPKAKEFYKEKVTFLKSNLEQLQETITQREQQHRVLLDVMQSKMQEMSKKKEAN
ncbi:subunit of tubulin prefoldin [Chytridiales sp. JEL 0842]|nr:subunit of tubulin prefoldin [Chytridiales sp. JEL 0842]